VRRGKAKLAVLTETADREYRTKVLCRKLNRRQTVKDTTYFPDPATEEGVLGEGTAQSHMYSRNDAADETNVTVNERINAWRNTAGYIAVTDYSTGSKAAFYQALRHEVQHDADKHGEAELSAGVAMAEPGSPEEDFQKALRTYKTEYRAHSYQGGSSWDVAMEPTPKHAHGRDWDRRQFKIFEHIHGGYPSVNAAMGGDEPKTWQQRHFLTEIHDYANPDTEGFNKFHSIRIDDLYLALRAVHPQTQDAADPAVVALLTAAGKLDFHDVAYIRASGIAEEAFMLRAMIADRLTGAALTAFWDVVSPYRPPAPRKKREL
jgi:hypothetical protein